MPSEYKELTNHLQDIQRLNGALALLGWDQEVTMPPRGARNRAGQRAALAGVVHERLTDPELGILLSEAAEDPDLDAGWRANVRETTRLRERAIRLPESLVRDIAEAAALAQPEWVQARRDDDWSRFAVHLDRIVRLKRLEAVELDLGEEPYDALLDEFEPGARTTELLPVFTTLRASLTDLMSRLDTNPRPTDDLGSGPFPSVRQDALSRDVLAAIGYQFESGRLDVSAHPFTESMGPGDVRITTSYAEHDVLTGLWSSLHEGGHALYEQGLPEELRNTPAGQSVSLGIHESQSRLWENHVGRGRPFCTWLAPRLAATFPDRLGDLDADRLYRASNVVRPTPIRIEADEVTYNLHIILRFGIERALIAGDLDVAGVPDMWRSEARELLGLTITDDRTGPLQDIHWCLGALGYFPTYTLGNLYAAMFWNAARDDLPDLDQQLAAGDYRPLLAWLRKKIHTRGSILSARDICRNVTGHDLRVDDFVAYLNTKFDA